MTRGMGVFLYGGLAFVVYGVYRLRQAGPGSFMEERFTGTLMTFIGVCWLIGPILTVVTKRLNRAKEQRLLANGVRAAAVVEKVEHGGVWVNYMPVVHVTVRVQPDGRPAFQHRQRLVTPKVALPQVGDVVNVAYDPADPDDMVFETDKGFNASLGTMWKVRRAAKKRKADSVDRDQHLARLAKLRADGALTDAEFEQAKSALAGESA